MAMKFWENHAKEMRRARLLSAAAVLVAHDWDTGSAVSNILELEKEIAKQLSKERAEPKN